MMRAVGLAVLVAVGLFVATGEARANEPVAKRCIFLKALTRLAPQFVAKRVEHPALLLPSRPIFLKAKSLLPSDLKGLVSSAARLIIPHAPEHKVQAVLAGPVHVEPAYFDGGGYGATVAGLL